MDQTKSKKPIYSISSVLSPVAGLATYIVIASIVGATDSTHGFFNVFLVAELLWYFSIAGFVSGVIGAVKKEHPRILNIVGLLETGLLTAFFSVAILTS